MTGMALAQTSIQGSWAAPLGARTAPLLCPNLAPRRSVAVPWGRCIDAVSRPFFCLSIMGEIASRCHTLSRRPQLPRWRFVLEMAAPPFQLGLNEARLPPARAPASRDPAVTGGPSAAPHLVRAHRTHRGFGPQASWKYSRLSPSPICRGALRAVSMGKTAL